MINKLTIFGVGLIGGSLGLGLKRAGYVRQIVGCSRDEAHLARAVERGAIDAYELDPVLAIANADVVLLAVPLRAMEAIMSQIAAHLGDSTILTDAGSSKQSVVDAAKRAFGQQAYEQRLPHFVPGHPIAGREQSGVDAALADLYVDHKVILTPLPETSPKAIETVSAMWRAVGADVRTLAVAQHDLVLAATSHLPHVIAYSLVDTLSQTSFVQEIFQYAAGGFRDLSRIASSDPTMWRDICLENREAILDVLDQYQSNLLELRAAIARGDAESLSATFAAAKATRDSHLFPAVSQE